MFRLAIMSAVMALATHSAQAQGFTVLNDRGGSVERSRTVAGGTLSREINRTTAAGQKVGRETSLERNGSSSTTRTVTTVAPNGHQNTRSAKITRN